MHGGWIGRRVGEHHVQKESHLKSQRGSAGRYWKQQRW